MLYGVHEDFPQGRREILLFALRKIRSQLAQELHDSVNRVDFAAQAQCNPVRMRRGDVDIVFPFSAFQSGFHHFREGRDGKGLAEETKGMLSDCRYDVVRGVLDCHDQHLRCWADPANTFQ